jgi:hypothetical protein
LLFKMRALCDCLILVVIPCVAWLAHALFEVRPVKMSALCVCLLTVQILLVARFTQTFFKVELVNMRTLGGHRLFLLFISSRTLTLYFHFFIRQGERCFFVERFD